MPQNLDSLVNVAAACEGVRQRYEARLAEVEKLLAADAAFDPKSPPNREYVDERRALLEKLRTTSIIAEEFRGG